MAATLLTLSGLSPSTRPYQFEENWSATEVLGLDALRELSAKRRDALQQTTSPLRSRAEVVQSIMQYLELLAKFHSEVRSPHLQLSHTAHAISPERISETWPTFIASAEEACACGPSSHEGHELHLDIAGVNP